MSSCRLLRPVGHKGPNRLILVNRTRAIEGCGRCDTPTEVQEGGIRLQRSWGANGRLRQRLLKGLFRMNMFISRQVRALVWGGMATALGATACSSANESSLSNEAATLGTSSQ